MPDLIMMKGLPASGKTQWANMLFEVMNTTSTKGVIVSKDNLRDDKPHSHEREARAIYRHENLVSNHLREGKTVIVDDCNLNPIHLTKFRVIVEEIGNEIGEFIPVIVIDFTYVPLEECLNRNRERDKTPEVPQEAIIEMHDRWLRRNL